MDTAASKSAVSRPASRVLPSKKTNNGAHRQSERGQDLYPTPPQLTEALLQVERLPSLIWECAAGMGHMASVLQASGHLVTASDVVDYKNAVPSWRASWSCSKINQAKGMAESVLRPFHSRQ